MTETEKLLKRIEELETIGVRHREMEKTLRESEELYRNISQKSFAGIYVVQEGRFCNANANAASYAGYRADELIGRKSDSIIHPDDKKGVKKNAREMLHGRSTAPYIFRIITKRGTIRWIMETVTSITYGGKPAILGNCMDITEHRLDQERIRESENLYRAIFETTVAATIIIEEDTTISLANTGFVNLSGYNRDEWVGKRSWTEFVVPGDVERMKTYHYLRRIDSDAAPRNYEFGLVDAQGRIRDVILMVDMIPGTKKSVASFVDITDLKLATANLRESENLYRTIFENTGTATIIIEEDLSVSLANSEFESLSGAAKESWEGNRKWTGLFSEKDLQKMIHYHQLRRIDADAAPRNYQCSLIDKEGNKKVILLAVAMIPGTKKSVVSLTDITEQKRTEAALRKREQEVQKNSRNLKDANTALKVLLKQREEDRGELEEKVLSNVKGIVLPYLEKLKISRTNPRDLSFVNILEANLTNIISPFSHRLSSRHLNLTPKELQVANLIKEGKTSKEIADIMGICTGAVSLHRDHIRKKLGINNKKMNLQSYLNSLSS
jgi:PAS domain S-box-containing protein